MHTAPTPFQTEGDAQGWLAAERQVIPGQEWVSSSVRAERAAEAEVQRRAHTLSADADAEAWLAGRPTHPEWRRPAAGDEVRLRGARDNHILPAFGGAKAYGVPKAILQTAEDDSLISRNPCRFGGAGDAMRRRESVALSPSELAALADAMPRRWRALTLVSAVCRSSGREGMVWHDLRHTANTLAADADAGASQATRQARMGHADPRVSAIYLHTSTSDDRELADALFEMAARNEGTR